MTPQNGCPSSLEELSLILANNPNRPDEGPAKEAKIPCQSLYQRHGRQFAICKWWQQLRFFFYCVFLGLMFLGSSMAGLSQFPWEDSTFGQKLVTLLMTLPYNIFGIWMFIVAVAIWIDPHQLKFDGNDTLILQSLGRRQRIAIKSIETIILRKVEADDRGDDALGIRVKFSRGKLRLCGFGEREEFLKVLKITNPTIIVETDFLPTPQLGCSGQ